MLIVWFLVGAADVSGIHVPSASSEARLPAPSLTVSNTMERFAAEALRRVQRCTRRAGRVRLHADRF